MLRIVTKVVLVSNVGGKIMSVFVLIPLRKVIEIMIAKLIKMIKRLILIMTKEKLNTKLKRMIKIF